MRALSVGGFAAALILGTSGCGTEPGDTQLEGEFLLVRINEQSLPYDHEGLGCCTYLSGRFEFTDNQYSGSITARNRNNGLVFDMSETGTWTRSGNVVTFTRLTWEVQPLLLSEADLSEDTFTVGVGGEGPGSPDQFEMVFRKSPPLQ